MVAPLPVRREIGLLGLVLLWLAGACSYPIDTTGPSPVPEPSPAASQPTPTARPLTSTAAPSTSASAWPDYQNALFPLLSPQEFDRLLNSDKPPATSAEIVAAFAMGLLEMDDPEVILMTDGTDSTGWLVQQGNLSVDVRTQLLAWRPDGTALSFVTHASSTGRSDDWFLSVSINDRTGTWHLSVLFPPCSSQNEISLTSGSWEVSAEANAGSVEVELPAEPLEPPKLTITCRSPAGELIAIDTRVLKPGEFAAG